MKIYDIEDFKYVEDMSIEENLKRTLATFNSLPKPNELHSTKKVGQYCLDGNKSRYKDIYDDWIGEYNKIEEGLGKAELNDERLRGHIEGQYKMLLLMFEILVSRDLYSYPADVAAELWLREEGYIGGSAVDSDFKPLICAHLYCGGYDLAPMISSNWVSFDAFNSLSDFFREAFKESKMNAMQNMPETCREWFDSLPDIITVYRGCERDRVNALSWTTEKHVAERFALGGRGANLEDPVIATTTVKKSEVFFASNQRNEFEIVHDPTHCDVDVVNFTYAKSSLAGSKF